MSLSHNLFLLIIYTSIGYLSLFFINYKHLKKLQFILFNLIMSPYIFLNIYNYLTIDFFFENFFVILGQFWFIFLAFLLYKTVNSSHKNVNFNVLAFQNSYFMAYPIIITFSDSNSLKLLLFMFMIGFNILVFSLGTLTLSKTKDYKKILNLPLFSGIVPILIILSGMDIYKSNLLLQIENMLGLVLIPGALFFFGGVINHSMNGKKFKLNFSLFRLIIAKYLLFPAITFVMLLVLKANSLVFITFLLQSLMPPAINLVLLPASDKDKNELAKQMFVLYIVFLVGISFFLVGKAFFMF
jgi:predicted permease